ncbi:crossover junction endonuclease MUS81 isoform X1 [Colossoma macropomum]|uniref:crossover junction endonuclease MUS81 isoform X1 n=1 Tax=Colossoma macropomum TaxID=42526 RepID=UPI0018645B1C|nr:crossover junction endonuclease MUS81 isoform X1 [Colossoma macropomum]
MSPEPVRVGRKRPLPSCPNPLFLFWLTEMRDHAKEKGLKTQYVYQKAIDSLKKYPLPLKNGKEAKILQNFGDGICKILDERLQKYYRENGVDASIHTLPSGPSQTCSTNLAPPKPSSASSKDPSLEGGANMRNAEGDAGKEKGGKKKREYVPQKRSGGYAVLLTLYRHSQVPGSKGFMFKNELQTEAQYLCDKSFTVPELGSKYTAWSSVSTLIQKDLLLKTHNPARYSLTELGLALAEKLESGERGRNDRQEEQKKSEAENSEDGPVTVDLTLDKDKDDEDEGEDSCSTREAPTTAVTETRAEIIAPSSGLSGKCQTSPPLGECLLPGSYDIVLCVDFIETTGGNTARKQELVKELQRNGVTFDIRKLNVGDFLWVAREKVTPVPGQLRPPVAKELVLDYIIERKRMDDLCGSIMDGRFREQKFRLKRCGLHKPIYLVEECGSAAAHMSLPESTLQQAIVNTQVVDGFFVKRVQDVKESAAYLTVMTRYLQKLYQNCTLFCHSRELEGNGDFEVENGVTERENPRCSLISFTEFNYGAVKNKCQTVRDVFARQLMQISGISGDKAAAILEHYSTVSSLLKAYAQCATEAEGEKLLSSIKYGKLKRHFPRNLGPALSRTIYQLYCTRGSLS